MGAEHALGRDGSSLLAKVFLRVPKAPPYGVVWVVTLPLQRRHHPLRLECWQQVPQGFGKVPSGPARAAQVQVGNRGSVCSAIQAP